MFICEIPGINNYYRVEGDTQEAAEAKLWETLEAAHGGLASGMFFNRITFNPQEAREELQAWLDQVEARNLWVRAGTIPVFGTRIEASPVPPEEIEIPDDVRVFGTPEPDAISFGNSAPDGTRESYWEAVEPTADRWGNTATWEDGLELAEGCYELGYEDDSMREYGPTEDLLDRAGEELFEEWDGCYTEGISPTEFIEWVEEKDLIEVSWCGDEQACNGCSQSFGYLTTNQPLTGEAWRAAARQYLLEKEAS